MKTSILIATTLAGTVWCSPRMLERRQQTANDILNGQGCKKVTLIFARASTEPGNMGMSMGPKTCSGLKAKLSNDVACQGVGRPYTAGLVDNVSASGTTQAAIGEATRMFTMTNQKCPASIIVAGGYSQGTAVMMNAVSKLPEDLKRKVAGVVLFGYTKNAQTKSSIPNYPKEKVKVFCSSGDGVCGGTLAVTGGHFSYMGDGSGPKAVDFLLSAIKGERVSGDSGSSEATGGAKGGKGFGGKGFGGKGMGGKGKGSKGSSPTETSNIPATSEASDSTPNKGAPNATPDIESSE